MAAAIEPAGVSWKSSGRQLAGLVARRPGKAARRSARAGRSRASRSSRRPRPPRRSRPRRKQPAWPRGRARSPGWPPTSGCRRPKTTCRICRWCRPARAPRGLGGRAAREKVRDRASQSKTRARTKRRRLSSWSSGVVVFVFFVGGHGSMRKKEAADLYRRPAAGEGRKAAGQAGGPCRRLARPTGGQLIGSFHSVFAYDPSLLARDPLRGAEPTMPSTHRRHRRPGPDAGPGRASARGRAVSRSRPVPAALEARGRAGRHGRGAGRGRCGWPPRRGPPRWWPPRLRGRRP